MIRIARLEVLGVVPSLELAKLRLLLSAVSCVACFEGCKPNCGHLARLAHGCGFFTFRVPRTSRPVPRTILGPRIFRSVPRNSLTVPGNWPEGPGKPWRRPTTQFGTALTAPHLSCHRKRHHSLRRRQTRSVANRWRPISPSIHRGRSLLRQVAAEVHVSQASNCSLHRALQATPPISKESLFMNIPPWAHLQVASAEIPQFLPPSQLASWSVPATLTSWHLGRHRQAGPPQHTPGTEETVTRSGRCLWIQKLRRKLWHSISDHKCRSTRGRLATPPLSKE